MTSECLHVSQDAGACARECVITFKVIDWLIQEMIAYDEARDKVFCMNDVFDVTQFILIWSIVLTSKRQKEDFMQSMDLIFTCSIFVYVNLFISCVCLSLPLSLSLFSLQMEREERKRRKMKPYVRHILLFL